MANGDACLSAGGARVKHNLQALVRRWEGNTISSNPRLEVVSALVIAPLLEEAVFRLIPFRLAVTFPCTRWRVALGSAMLFGL
ncbi:MAG: hypothetical protein M3069_05800, partial [Chloroflexota bacterium]|nr:hypothetical protein [Chloroflexota bacterium]